MQSPLVYPGLHPLSQTPLCLWHEVSFRQWPLQLLIQSYPKVPSSHSKSVCFYKYLMTHGRFSKNNNSLVQHILNPCSNVTKREKSKCVLQKKKLKKEFTFIAQQSCPSSITSTVTLTSHVVTDGTVSTMSFTLLRAVGTERTISAFCFRTKTL